MVEYNIFGLSLSSDRLRIFGSFVVVVIVIGDLIEVLPNMLLRRLISFTFKPYTITVRMVLCDTF